MTPEAKVTQQFKKQLKEKGFNFVRQIARGRGVLDYTLIPPPDSDLSLHGVTVWAEIKSKYTSHPLTPEQQVFIDLLDNSSVPYIIIDEDSLEKVGTRYSWEVVLADNFRSIQKQFGNP